MQAVGARASIPTTRNVSMLTYRKYAGTANLGHANKPSTKLDIRKKAPFSLVFMLLVKWTIINKKNTNNM